MSIILMIQIHIRIRADSVVSDTNGFINFWHRSFDTRRETRFVKFYSNHTMLISPPRSAHLVVFKVSAGRDPKNSTVQLNGRKLKSCHFKILNSQDNLFRAWHHSHSNPISCLAFSMTDDHIYQPLRSGRIWHKVNF